MEATVRMSKEYLVALAIRIKKGMGIQQFISFKDMDVAQIQEWIRNSNNIIPGIVLREMQNFPHTVEINY
ncbi:MULTISPECIES: hypothetical protein [unclassified Nostoc]|uniref:hypothetical protein n=1 Tax=unclassified Nostoc TaxID=2593658 RepID=UPI001D4EC82D|nr:hypothetical protein [Nostoc sp. JL23]MBN3877166.1 hypothetical protein [Nostoc sp. JL23]